MAEQETCEKFLEGYAQILMGACATGRRLTRDEMESLRSQGKRAAEAGIGLRSLVRAHLAAAQAVRLGLPPAAADHLLPAVEQAVDAFAEGHERAQRLAVRQEEAAAGNSSTTSSTGAVTWAASPSVPNASGCCCPMPMRSPWRRVPIRTTTVPP